MTTDHEIDYRSKSLPYLKWLLKRWYRLFGVTILNDRMLKAEYERIQQAIAEKEVEQSAGFSNETVTGA